MTKSIKSIYCTPLYLLKKYLPPLATVVAVLSLNSLLVTTAHAHGSIISPESRIYKCRFRDNPENPSNPACRAAKELSGSAQLFYDWTGVRQANANSNHQAVIGDGELCSGGNPDFRGINIARSDWQTTSIEADRNGRFEFIYHATAPHSTKDMIFYITKPGWAPNSALNWSDMEEFCRFGSVPLSQDSQGRNVYRMTCDLPQRTGQHVIYHIWQRDDSGEAFYSCSDVIFADSPPSPAPSECSSKAACMLPSIDLILSK